MLCSHCLCCHLDVVSGVLTTCISDSSSTRQCCLLSTSTSNIGTEYNWYLYQYQYHSTAIIIRLVVVGKHRRARRSPRDGRDPSAFRLRQLLVSLLVVMVVVGKGGRCGKTHDNEQHYFKRISETPHVATPGTVSHSAPLYAMRCASRSTILSIPCRFIKFSRRFQGVSSLAFGFLSSVFP
jgi:hypothetical protein